MSKNNKRRQKRNATPKNQKFEAAKANLIAQAQELRGGGDTPKDKVENNRVFDPFSDETPLGEIIDPMLPVRTRDGRLAWLIEVDARKPYWQIKAAVHDPLGRSGVIKGQFMSNGSFLNVNGGRPNAMDLFNVPLSDWMMAYYRLEERTINA